MANPLTTIAWHPTDQRLAGGTATGRVQVWDPAGTVQATQQVGEPLSMVGWADAGHTLISVTAEGQLHDWRLDQPRSQPTLLHDARVSYPPGAVSPNGQYIAFTGTFTTVELWDPTGHILQEWRLSVHAALGMQWRPDSAAVAILLHNGSVHLWDIAP